MKKLLSCALTFAFAGLGGRALAGDEKGAMPPAPKPDPAAEAAFKGMAGTWKCKGKMTMPPDMGGAQVETQSTMKIRPIVDGFAYLGEYESKKTKTMPAMKGFIVWGYDAVNKKLVEFGVDNMGNLFQGTADPNPEKTMYTETGVFMGKPAKSRTTVTRKGDKEVMISWDFETEPGKFTPAGEDTCKK